MAVMQKKRLCWNCEGNVSLAEETCPYCGVSVIPASLDGTQAHTPPYQTSFSQDTQIPPPPYSTEQRNELVEEKNEENSKELEDQDQDVSVDEFKNILFSLLFLLAGSMFFLFGLTLVLFSHQGVFTLQWDGSLWYVYSLLSLPLLFLGWRALLKLDAEQE